MVQGRVQTQMHHDLLDVTQYYADHILTVWKKTYFYCSPTVAQYDFVCS